MPVYLDSEIDPTILAGRTSKKRVMGEMNKARRARLEAAGFEEIDVQEWLGLSDVDMEVIDLKVAMAKAVIECRKAKHLSQKKLAALMESSQSRISAMERGDSSIELMARALFTLGVDRKKIAQLMA